MFEDLPLLCIAHVIRLVNTFPSYVLWGFWLSQRERQKVTSRLSLQVGEVENFPKLMRKKTPRIDPYPIIL